MHRATDAGLYLQPPYLSITTVPIGNHSVPAGDGRFAIAIFGAPEGGPYRGSTPSLYQGLCGPTRLLAVPSMTNSTARRREPSDAVAPPRHPLSPSLVLPVGRQRGRQVRRQGRRQCGLAGGRRGERCHRLDELLDRGIADRAAVARRDQGGMVGRGGIPSRQRCPTGTCRRCRHSGPSCCRRRCRAPCGDRRSPSWCCPIPRSTPGGAGCRTRSAKNVEAPLAYDSSGTGARDKASGAVPASGFHSTSTSAL